jgi:hypothetical protein
MDYCCQVGAGLFICVVDLSQTKDVRYKKIIDEALCHDQSPPR